MGSERRIYSPGIIFIPSLLSSPLPATAWEEGSGRASSEHPPRPQLNGRPFPATAWAEGAQLNGRPSLRERVLTRVRVRPIALPQRIVYRHQLRAVRKGRLDLHLSEHFWYPLHD